MGPVKPTLRSSWVASMPLIWGMLLSIRTTSYPSGVRGVVGLWEASRAMRERLTMVKACRPLEASTHVWPSCLSRCLISFRLAGESSCVFVRSQIKRVCYRTRQALDRWGVLGQEDQVRGLGRELDRIKRYERSSDPRGERVLKESHHCGQFLPL
jgi:hypothetical protein